MREETGPWIAVISGNHSGAPHLRAIVPADVHGVRGAGPLAHICGTAERLQSACSCAFDRLSATG
ncbi:MAG: hypothetical protein BWK76_25230 [Desulfobulbaceae bacterium A2]|nr:MAG: hypothetical protein BWK76_25230 [Desulfobulbaceae bacterium A2]